MAVTTSATYADSSATRSGEKSFFMVSSSRPCRSPPKRSTILSRMSGLWYSEIRRMAASIRFRLFSGNAPPAVLSTVNGVLSISSKASRNSEIASSLPDNSGVIRMCRVPSVSRLAMVSAVIVPSGTLSMGISTPSCQTLTLPSFRRDSNSPSCNSPRRTGTSSSRSGLSFPNWL